MLPPEAAGSATVLQADAQAAACNSPSPFQLVGTRARLWWYRGVGIGWKH